jgi:hypothetical protein
MNRRDTLKLMALYANAAGLSTIMGLLNGCESRTDAPTDSQAEYVPEILTGQRYELFTHVAERIIPETDTAGAAQAGVSRFADHMLAHWYTPEERQVFLDGLDDLEYRARERFVDSFVGIGAERQTELLAELEASSSGTWETGGEEAPSFIAMAKFLTIVGYYTSEIGATQELKTSIAPGEFKGCIPYGEVGRAWSGA